MVKKPGTKDLIGSWAFLIGFILTVLFAILVSNESVWALWTLAALGVIVGLLNITVHEVQPFLLAGAILVIVAHFGGEVFETAKIVSVWLDYVKALFVPATLIVALRSLWALGRSA